MTSVAVKSKSGGEVEHLTPESFPSWRRRVGKDTGFVVKLAENAERLVLTRRPVELHFLKADSAVAAVL